MKHFSIILRLIYYKDNKGGRKLFNKLILSGVILSSLITSNPTYSGINNKNVGNSTSVNHNVEVRSDNKNYIHVADVPLYNGHVSNITKTKDGMDILVTNVNGPDSSYKSLIFHINENTALNVEKQELHVGNRVDVFYSGAVTRSLPGQASAIAVNVVPDTYAYEGETKEVIQTKYGKMVSVTSKNKDTNFEEIIFNVNDSTEFQNGSISDLKKGSNVKVVYGPVMTMSLPPQTSALSIQFVK